MNFRSLSLATALLFAVAPAALAATSVEKIRNEKVVVTEDTLAPGESEELSLNQPTILVYMADGTAELGSAAGREAPVKEGQAVFEDPGAGILKNTGSAPLHFARIEFIGPGSKETWGKTGLAPAYVILKENQFARAYDIKIPPHEFEPQHTHHARVVVALSGAQLEHILPDGTKQPSTLKSGEIVWRPAATHTGHNMGNTPLWCIAVEPK